MAEDNSWWEKPKRKIDKDSWWKDECEICHGTGKNDGLSFYPDGRCEKCNGKGFV